MPKHSKFDFEERKVWHDSKPYWKGPYDCLVPWHCKSCTAADGGNTRGRDGSETEMAFHPQPSRAEWLKQHTVRDAKGRAIYVKQKKTPADR